MPDEPPCAPWRVSLCGQGAAVAIWTTTPWTIPANLAVAINDQLEYCVVEASVGAPCVWIEAAEEEG